MVLPVVRRISPFCAAWAGDSLIEISNFENANASYRFRLDAGFSFSFGRCVEVFPASAKARGGAPLLRLLRTVLGTP
jgi:hypothetical protein